MRLPKSLFLPVVAVLAIGCAAASHARNSVAAATAIMYNTAGAPIGTAQLTQDANGLVYVDIASISLPAGSHGIHFHAVGECEGSTSPAFSTAGGHYNPMGKQHGLQNPNGPHAGDNPNFTVPASGVAEISFSTDRVSLTPGTTTLFDADGSSLVIHAGPDDQTSDPAGNSGGRVACGVVRALP